MYYILRCNHGGVFVRSRWPNDPQIAVTLVNRLLSATFVCASRHLQFKQMQRLYQKNGHRKDTSVCPGPISLVPELSLCHSFMSEPESPPLVLLNFLMKSLRSRGFAQYARLPSLQRAIICNLFTYVCKHWISLIVRVCVRARARACRGCVVGHYSP